jgi:hypothetical protein
MIDIDSHISRLQAIDPGSHAAPGDVLLGGSRLQRGHDEHRDARLAPGRDARHSRKAQGMAGQLIAKVREVVASLSDVASISITVGSPFTVSVSVTFAGPSAAS